jgi:EmrB/QacA subfamily drug resistance transporter
VLVLVSVAQFMVILDVTVVNVALPSIGRSLGFAPADLQWVVTAYVLFTGGLLLLGGRTADLFGRRRVFLSGLLVFTAASLASGLAPSATALIVSRGAQGFGAAFLTPAALAIITTTYTGAQRTVALSTWGAISSAGAGAGLLLGGMLTTWLGWEWIFFINVPVGIVVGLLTLRLVDSDGPARAARRRLDLRGAGLVVAGLVLLVYALTGTTDHGWASARTLLLFTGSAALLAGFLLVERSSESPLLPPQTWRVRSLVAALGLMLGGTGILIGTFFLNSIYLQTVAHASALRTGLEFLPLVGGIALAAHLASHLLPRLGARTLAAVGLTLIAVGTLLFVLAPERASYAPDLLPGLLVIGVGVGLLFPAVSVTAMSDVRAERSGLASGLLMTAHEIGAALGVAVLSAVAAAGTGGAGRLHAGLATGYEDGFLAATVIAAALALGALLALPPIRPEGPTRAALH